ncbi:hypothetical protein HDU96_005636, partial [Phlyctochytrium bullatum]
EVLESLLEPSEDDGGSPVATAAAGGAEWPERRKWRLRRESRDDGAATKGAVATARAVAAGASGRGSEPRTRLRRVGVWSMEGRLEEEEDDSEDEESSASAGAETKCRRAMPRSTDATSARRTGAVWKVASVAGEPELRATAGAPAAGVMGAAEDESAAGRGAGRASEDDGVAGHGEANAEGKPGAAASGVDGADCDGEFTKGGPDNGGEATSISPKRRRLPGGGEATRWRSRPGEKVKAPCWRREAKGGAGADGKGDVAGGAVGVGVKG